MKKQTGFTLIEILIALMIFAIVGVMAAISLHRMIRTTTALKAADNQLMQLQVAMTLLRRDTAQMINRPVINNDGSQDPAMAASGDNKISFTRTGMSNPFSVNVRSNMQRVAYNLERGQFVRLTWTVLDLPPGQKGEKQVLLDNVQSLSWQFIAGDGHTTTIWPPAFNSVMQKQSNDSPLPKAILMVMQMQDGSIIQGVFPVVARGINATAAS